MISNTFTFSSKLRYYQLRLIINKQALDTKKSQSKQLLIYDSFTIYKDNGQHKL